MNEIDPELFARLQHLADEAGISTVWYDYRGVLRTVAPETLRALLSALELPSATFDEIATSRAHLAAEAAGQVGEGLPPLITAQVAEATVLPNIAALAGAAWRLCFEDGEVRDGRFAMEGPATIEAIDRPGYHSLEIGDGAEQWTTRWTTTLAIAPPRCYAVSDAMAAAGRDPAERPWGVSVQLYSVARPGDAGLGDYAALATLAGGAAGHGAAAVAISPVHAMFSADLRRFSPYGPSSRLLANVLHVDPVSVLGADAAGEAFAAVDVDGLAGRLEANALIDWPASSRLRLAVLRRLFDRMMKSGDDVEVRQREAFMAHRAAAGDVLESHARFEALHAVLAADDTSMLGGWRQWPVQYHDPDGAAVAAFAEEHADDVAFHAFLQWQAARQLEVAQHAARDAGMPIGIVADLAVGADGNGSQAWSRQRDMLQGLSIGAPPDLLNALGQSWGLAPFSPRALRRGGFRPWIEMLRSAFGRAGGVRIDHVLGLMRMWLVPYGVDPTEGAYLRYPFDDLMRLVALESWRHRAIVIGEDLGTVPEGFTDRLVAAGLLGIRVLWFERWWDSVGQPFRVPDQWSNAAIAVTTTHDLPTTAGWWCGRDIEWREKLDLFGDYSSAAIETVAREADRDLLWRAFCESGAAQGDRPPADRPPLVEALRHVGSTAAPLAMIPVEDILGLVEQPNLPGTVDTHPNWRMRLPVAVDQLFDSDQARARIAAVVHGRARR